MNIKDIIVLAKAGYKKDDINDILEKVNNMEEKETEADTETNHAEDTDEEVEETPAEETIDYKSLYEESQKALKVAQLKNTKTNIAESTLLQKSDEDIFTEALRSFM